MISLSTAFSQGDSTQAQAADTAAAATTAAPEQSDATVTEEAAAPEQTFHQRIKDKFIEGGVPFMWPILICMILGLAVSIERIISLNLATSNNQKLLASVKASLDSSNGDFKSAHALLANNSSPMAAIYRAGLDKASHGVDMAEKAVVSTGGVEMGKLERGLIWISLFISLGPMLGFFGTVVGMVQAFDDIQAAGDISPQVVAGGMKVALITTVGGLIVGMILQILYNYLVSKIDNLTNSMESASVDLIDLIVEHSNKGK